MYALVGIIDVCCIWPSSKYMVLNPELAEYEKDMKGKGNNGPDGGLIHNKSRTGRTCSGLLHVRSNMRKEVLCRV